MEKLLFYTGIGLLLFCCCGISIRSNPKHDEITLNEIDLPNKKSISLIIDGKLRKNLTTIYRNRLDKSCREAIKESFESSSLFSKIDLINQNNNNILNKTDLVAEITYKGNIEGSGWCATSITMCSLYLIPWKREDILFLSAEFKDRRGKTLKKYETSEKVVDWSHLFFIFLYPFEKSYWEVRKDIYFDMSTTIIRSALKDGILNE